MPTTNCQYNLETPAHLQQSLLENFPSQDVCRTFDLLRLTCRQAGSAAAVSAAYLGALHEIITQQAPGASSAFMIGCATGALAFELSKTFESVVASDFCAQFVATAEKLQKGQSVPIPRSATSSAVSLPSGANPDRLVFKQA